MPVKPVPGGFKWGDKGKVFKKRSDAAKQGRAIMANKRKSRKRAS